LLPDNCLPSFLLAADLLAVVLLSTADCLPCLLSDDVERGVDEADDVPLDE
jgi:hypothetical protein